VVGTLGVLRDAAIHRLLEIRAALDRLSTHTNFRASQDLYVQVLQAVLNELGQTPAP
jgi:predicted nucleic acid-binding protein